MSASSLRRLVLVVSVAAAAAFAAALAWSSRRGDAVLDAGAPEWPAWPETSGGPEPSDGSDASGGSDAAPGAAWVAGSEGSAPEGYPIKLNGNSGIFHVPGGRFYDRTGADRWYATAEAAVADGYRQSKA
jgi:hypothetical protein